MYYTYVLYDKTRKIFYVGSTKDIGRRLKEHKNGEVNTTSKYNDFILVFYEAFYSKQDALRREHYFKTTKGRRSLRLVIENSLKEIINLCPVV